MSCGDCSHIWLPRTAKPIKCPNCQMREKLELVIPADPELIAS